MRDEMLQRNASKHAKHLDYKNHCIFFFQFSFRATLFSARKKFLTRNLVLLWVPKYRKRVWLALSICQYIDMYL